MKRDVQVGVILGVIILAIIGVFLSTRTTVKEPIIPIPGIGYGQTDVLDIQNLPHDSSNDTEGSFKEIMPTVRDGGQKRIITNVTKTEKQDNIIEGSWEKAEDEEQKQENWRDVHSGDAKRPTTTRFQIHKVQPGEDLSKIARKYYRDTSKWSTIYNANRDRIQDYNFLRVGTELIIPDIPEEKIASQQVRTETSIPSLSQVVEVEGTKPAGRIHRVQRGDSIYKLAVKYYNDGTKWNKILEANKKVIKDPKSLRIGQELIIPEL
jgi:LysM repeat protein